MFPKFKNVKFYDTPYKHFTSSSNLNEKTIQELLSWLDLEAPWKLVETDFYEQYELSLNSSDNLGEAKFLIDQDTLSQLRAQVESLFKVNIEEKVEVVAHKLVKGQTIRVHNDYLQEDHRETHRVLLQISKEFKESNGGYLMTFNGPNSDDLNSVIPPIPGSIQGFEISQNSHHAVSTVHGGVRYTIIYTFKERSSC
ncbi:cyclophane-containing peptide 2OG-Fe(II) oxygenase YhhC [Vibrio echinoideorum]|uniref:cyclophane-containing peptide 2OG-Fe(II) oxygenase YhhC n=1 Tax=Vibrio echinoideorum TaxID=2100116 RepID=UPI0010802363|nr:cyclophane-containing peptide 2OG-Fe(II) oxygenase YhhC [Vibrio echinoideorum]